MAAKKVLCLCSLRKQRLCGSLFTHRRFLYFLTINLIYQAAAFLQATWYSWKTCKPEHFLLLCVSVCINLHPKRLTNVDLDCSASNAKICMLHFRMRRIPSGLICIFILIMRTSWMNLETEPSGFIFWHTQHTSHFCFPTHFIWNLCNTLLEPAWSDW